MFSDPSGHDECDGLPNEQARQWCKAHPQTAKKPLDLNQNTLFIFGPAPGSSLVTSRQNSNKLDYLVEMVGDLGQYLGIHPRFRIPVVLPLELGGQYATPAFRFDPALMKGISRGANIISFGLQVIPSQVENYQEKANYREVILDAATDVAIWGLSGLAAGAAVEGGPVAMFAAGAGTSWALNKVADTYLRPYYGLTYPARVPCPCSVPEWQNPFPLYEPTLP